MTDSNLAFAKLVANPTPTAWSQAYDAGKLFAVLSLEKEDVSTDNPDFLNVLGKDVLATLEQEFFTLENKDLASIKQAITTATNKIGDGVKASFVIVYLVGNILYLFTFGKGKVVLKRGSKVGTILNSDEDAQTLKSASGYLQNGDLVILETEQYSHVVSSQTLAMALDHESPKDIAETLAPNIHEKENGGAAALFVGYKEDQNFVAALEAQGITPNHTGEQEASNIDFDKVEEDSSPVNDPSQEQGGEEPAAQNLDILDQPTNPIGFGTQPMGERRGRNFGLKRASLPHSKKLILTVAIIILLVFLGSIFLAVKNRESGAQKALFTKVFSQAEAKYNEGQNLADLNKSLAHDSFVQSQKILNDNKAKFSKGSSEEKQILSLLGKVDQALNQTSGVTASKAASIPLSQSQLLTVVAEHTSSSYFAQDSKNIYFIDSKGIEQTNKTADKTTLTVEKSWGKEGGLGTFLTNLYVLDKNDGILKFAATTAASKSAFTKSDYFAKDAPDLTLANSMAIDGSVYILFSDGQVQKYNKGVVVAFKITGLTKPLSKPTRIWTDADATNVYILDNGNSRIVVLNKEGAYQSEYQAPELKNARDFEVLEKDKAINFLSGGKAYKINL